MKNPPMEKDEEIIQGRMGGVLGIAMGFSES